MLHRTTFLAVLTGTSVLAVAGPAVAAPAPAAAAATVTSFDVNRGMLHHNGDPRQGSIQIELSLQQQVVGGQMSIRAHATVAKAGFAVRVQIDQVSMILTGFNPSVTETDSKPLNSGAAVSVSKDTPWFDRTGMTHGATFSRGALVRYSTRWSDGSLTHGIFRTGDDQYSSTFAKPGPPIDQRVFDTDGVTTITRYGDPARGSVTLHSRISFIHVQGPESCCKIWAIQPTAQLEKVVGTRTVQIDAIEAQGYSQRADGSMQVESAWPANATPRSSGSHFFTYLVTAYTPVTQDRSGVLRSFRVITYYSIRWNDGTLTTGRFVGPMTSISHAFVGGIGTFNGF